MAHPQAIAARVKKQSDAEAIGIDPTFISMLVDSFYDRIRKDSMLGPIFAERISDWPHHLNRMKEFWSSVLHKSGQFSGNPMMKHVAIPTIENTEFSHWLRLFSDTLEGMETTPQVRSLILARAEMIAESLLTGIRIHRDGIIDLRKLKG